MAKLTVMSLNGENMVDLFPRDAATPREDSRDFWRAKLLAEMIRSALADARRYLAEQSLHQRLNLRTDFVRGQVGAHQPHTAVDVVSHPAR